MNCIRISDASMIAKSNVLIKSEPISQHLLRYVLQRINAGFFTPRIDTLNAHRHKFSENCLLLSCCTTTPRINSTISIRSFEFNKRNSQSTIVPKDLRARVVVVVVVVGGQDITWKFNLFLYNVE